MVYSRVETYIPTKGGRMGWWVKQGERNIHMHMHVHMHIHTYTLNYELQEERTAAKGG